MPLTRISRVRTVVGFISSAVAISTGVSPWRSRTAISRRSGRSFSIHTRCTARTRSSYSTRLSADIPCVGSSSGLVGSARFRSRACERYIVRKRLRATVATYESARSGSIRLMAPLMRMRAICARSSAISTVSRRWKKDTSAGRRTASNSSVAPGRPRCASRTNRPRTSAGGHRNDASCIRHLLRSASDYGDFVDWTQRVRCAVARCFLSEHRSSSRDSRSTKVRTVARYRRYLTLRAEPTHRVDRHSAVRYLRVSRLSPQSSASLLSDAYPSRPPAFGARRLLRARDVRVPTSRVDR
jgi:hypothetical protein